MASCGSVPSVSISRYVQHLRVATKLIWMLFRRETYFFTREMLMCLTTCSFPKRLFRWYVIDFHHLYSLWYLVFELSLPFVFVLTAWTFPLSVQISCFLYVLHIFHDEKYAIPRGWTFHHRNGN
jgi:nucleoside recognition membrane protein YjiH